MANGSGSTWTVRVVWQAVPESMNYFDLSAADVAVVDQRLIDQVNSLVPPADQAKWQNLVLTVVSFEELSAKVNALLKREARPPAGTELVIEEAATIWVPRPPHAHDVWQAAMLKDTGATAARPWTFAVSHSGSTYTARMGLSYECLHARVP